MHGWPRLRGGDLAEHVVEVAALDVHLLGLDQPRADEGGELGGDGRAGAGARAQPHLAVGGAQRLDLGDGRELGQRLDDGLGPAGRDTCMRDGVVIGQPAHEVLGRAVGDDAAAVDDHGPRAHGLHLLQDVRGDDDGLVLGHVGDELAHLVLLVGVEAVGGLVHDQHLRVVQDGLGDGDAALEALRQRLDPLLQHGGELRLLDRGGDAPLGLLAVEAADLGDEGEEGARRHVAVAGRTLGQVAELALRQLGMTRARRRRRCGRCPRPAPGSPSSIFMVVDLPAPLGPRKPSTSPCWTCSEMPSTARISPKRFCEIGSFDQGRH